MDAARRETFETCFDNLVAQRMVVTLQDKIALLDELYQAAVAQGSLPISPTEFARINPASPQAQAILAGEEVSLGGASLQGERTIQSRLSGLPNAQKLLIMLGIALLPVLFFFILTGLDRRGEAPTPTATPRVTLTATPTISPSSTPQPQAAATPYAMILATARVPSGINDPVSVEFGGLAFVLYEAQLQGGAWRPLVAEWLPGTELRRVVTVPYSVEVGTAVARLSYGDPLRLRLVSGEVAVYRLSEILRLQRYQIEVLGERSPSLAIVLYGERSTGRYVLVGEALQPVLEPTPTWTPQPSATSTPSQTSTPIATESGDGGSTPTETLIPSETPTPSATITATSSPSPTLSPTPVFAFTPPAPVTTVITETWTVANPAAGLTLSILACDRVAQIGSTHGSFLLCQVTLSAAVAGASYSGQALAISEYAQVERATSDWWPPVLAVVGGLGDGVLAQVGDTVSGKVAGEVAKEGIASQPVLLWEQDGLRYIIYLEH